MGKIQDFMDRLLGKKKKPAPTPAPAPAPTPPPPPPPEPVIVTWYKWADENETVILPPDTKVRYGANDKWIEKVMGGTVRADNETFGDPIYGTPKTLEATMPVVKFPYNVVTGNTTPDAPGVSANDSANTLDFTHALGDSEIEVSVNGAGYAALTSVSGWNSGTGVIDVGNVHRAAGYYVARTKAATGRDPSPTTSSPEFLLTPDAPGISANDTANTLDFTHALGDSEIEVSVNGAGYVALSSISGWNSGTGVIDVGDVARAAGYWVARIKAATGRTVSATTSSPAFTTGVVSDDPELLTGYIWATGTEAGVAPSIAAAFDGTATDNNGWKTSEMSGIRMTMMLPKKKRITQVGYAQHPGYSSYMVGGKFQGSNDGSSWTDLYTLLSGDFSGDEYALKYKAISNTTRWKYVSYLGPDNSARSSPNLVASDIEWWGKEGFTDAKPAAPTITGYVTSGSRSITFAASSGIPLSEHEYSINNGETFATPGSTTISLADADYPYGSIVIRVKETTTRPASDDAINTTDYVASSFSSANLPTYTDYVRPNSGTTPAPGEAFAPTMPASLSGSTPTFMEYHKDAGADNMIYATIDNLTTSGSFKAYGNGGYFTPKIPIDEITFTKSILADACTIHIPGNQTRNFFLLWAKNANGYSRPVAINKARATHSLAKVEQSEYLYIGGENLTGDGEEMTNSDTGSAAMNSFVYLKNTSTSAMINVSNWIDYSNPKMLKVLIHSSVVPVATYEVWVHNGKGGEYGWSKCHRNTQVIAVRTWGSVVDLANVLAGAGVAGNKLHSSRTQFTGSITSGSNILTINTNTSDFVAGMGVAVEGAGAELGINYSDRKHRAPLDAQITAYNNTTKVLTFNATLDYAVDTADGANILIYQPSGRAFKFKYDCTGSAGSNQVTLNSGSWQEYINPSATGGQFIRIEKAMKRYPPLIARIKTVTVVGSNTELALASGDNDTNLNASRTVSSVRVYHDNTIVVQKAWIGGQICKLPTGHFLHAGSINPSDNAALRGNGKELSLLICSPIFYGTNGICTTYGPDNMLFEDVGWCVNQVDLQWDNTNTAPFFLKVSSDMKMKNFMFDSGGPDLTLGGMDSAYKPPTDLAGANNLFMEGCKIKAGCFSFQSCWDTGGSFDQVIKDSTFEGINDANILLATPGSKSSFFINNTFKDQNPSDVTKGDGWSKGRAIYLAGSALHVTMVNNIFENLTVRPQQNVLPNDRNYYEADPNSGEMILLESNPTLWLSYGSGYSISGVSGTSMNANGYTESYSNTDIYDTTRSVWIKGGKGVGQYRRIMTSNGSGAITIDRPWTVNPDSTSKVCVGGYAAEIFIYGLDATGKANATDNTHKACAVFQPGGGCFFMNAEKITADTVRWMFSPHIEYEPNTVGGVVGTGRINGWSIMKDCSANNVYEGLRHLVDLPDKNGYHLLGYLYRDVTITNNVRRYAAGGDGSLNATSPGNPVIGGLIFENSQIKNPTVWKYAGQNQVVYKTQE